MAAFGGAIHRRIVVKLYRNRPLIASAIAVLMAASTLTVGLTASPSGASNQYLTLAQATAQFKLASAPVKWNGPTTQALAPKTEKVAILSCDLELQGCVVATDSVEAAASALGWTY